MWSRAALIVSHLGLNRMFLSRLTMLALPLSAMLTMTSATHAQEDKTDVDDVIGYFLGFSVGQSFAGQGFEDGDFTFEAMQKGMADALAGNDPGLTQEQLEAAQGRIQAMLQKRQSAAEADMQKQSVMNQEKSDMWMKQNAANEGIQDLGKGIQYKVLKEGTGASPSATDTVSVHYEGKLTNGEVFDSSIARGEPTQFPVNRVIQGWQLALQKMKVGSKWMLFIPPAMAYGENGAPPKIGPNEVLIFEVELLDIL